MTRLAAVVILLGLSAPALPYGSVEGKVTKVRVDKEGRAMVFFDQSVGGQPASCRDSYYANALAFDTTTAGGRSVLAMAIAAKATGDTISAIGTGTCAVYGNSVEDWSYGIAE